MFARWLSRSSGRSGHRREHAEIPGFSAAADRLKLAATNRRPRHQTNIEPQVRLAHQDSSGHGSDLSLIPLPTPVVDLIGNAGAILTTVCWLPQAIKIIRDRETRALSLPTNLAFTLGMILWLVYGMALPDWPLIWSSAITVSFMLVIVGLKIRYG
jgi:MtN3 and saliva related transmembrane protein